MCGIVGYTGSAEAPEILLEGLSRLEYRGYDSAGIAAINSSGKLNRERCKGKIARLKEVLSEKPLKGKTAIGHTRWATHGKPSDENAHPHSDCRGNIVVVHNGIIENYMDLKTELISEGHIFKSETDTEVIAHLVEKYTDRGDALKSAVFKAINKLKGSYALGVISSSEPERIIAARKDSPLIIGLGKDGNFIASDVPAILPYTKKVIYLDDKEMAVIEKDKIEVFNHDNNLTEKKAVTIDWDPVMAEKQGYRHFMLKEIYEQKQAIQETLLGRLDRDNNSVSFEHFNFDETYLKNINRIFLVACGTAYHACLIGKFLLEDHLKIPCEVDIGSEFRYRNPPIDQDTLVIAISQSGETADTLAALREAKDKGAKTSAICNVLGSTITREVDGVVYTHAGPEIGVASTKAFTSQLTALYLITLYMGRLRGSILEEEAKEFTDELAKLPLMVKEILDNEIKNIKDISHRYSKKSDFLYLGRNINYPIALEGALKLKEISYIHAEGYPAGEMKHGPIALIDEELPVVVIATKSAVYEKILSNIEEVKARDGKVIAIATEGDRKIQKLADDIIYVPKTLEIFTPILNTVPLQLLSYYIARNLGCDIDQPRNLAKSVTVE
ncbi:MAG: glutamine--fructose-6-phosphate transaminase (isomerizing) [Elusimicrobia bacterium]|jgi:glucosamine--fructose-6-phosphate aminotransferase (isomerizing)|nr:glutamine--fructose-6-phosphate transaminase (isomerizing) [Elusimicrobiota bacterium]